jgi:hypothetical protein
VTEILRRMPSRGALGQELPFGPTNFYQMFMGIAVPDPITFVIGEQWCNRPNLYPRQATLLKIIFLRDDLFTEFDLRVIAEWEHQYATTGNNGIVPNILWRIAWLKERGYKWFREVLLVMGRRAGKGHVTALAMAYVLWHYMAKGDPQNYYGVDRDKKLAALIFAGKRDQAKATVFGDMVNVITGSNCFVPFVNNVLAEKLTVYAPHDFVRIKRMREQGLPVDRDMATFEIMPKESTPMAGRGSTSFQQCLDPDTRVLKSDLTWVRIADLQPGDHVVGVDEQIAAGSQRRMRDATVEAVWKTTKSALRLTFDDGSSVVCSADHRWLAKDRGSGNTHWRTAGRMKVGNLIKHVVDPWETDNTFEGGYLSGIFDGEACVSGYHGRTGQSVFFSQNPGPVLDYTLDLMRQKGFTPQRHNTGVPEGTAEQWTTDGVSEHMRFLGTFRPIRLMPKSHRVWDGVAMRGGATPSGRPRAHSHKTITGIEHLPAQELVDITTTTRTFLAEGLVSHNCFDEMAHIVAAGSNRGADEVYNASKPSLDQFGKDAFLCEPSSPWQMAGQFYDNYLRAILLDDQGNPANPNFLMVQLASWDIYKDYEQSHLIRLFPKRFTGDLGEYADEPAPYLPRIRQAIQTFDDEMVREKAANPETFAVERESHFATALDAYLNPHKVDQVFEPWQGRLTNYGPRTILTTSIGRGDLLYKGHADPSKVNDKFGIAVAHTERDAEGRLHCVFDLLHHFDPADFPDGIIDYEFVDDWIYDNIIKVFMPDEFTFDQYNSIASIQRLQKKIRAGHLIRHVNVFEKTTTRQSDWAAKESAKAAINLGFVHAPADTPSAERAQLELKFLQLVGGRVDHPSAGPVQSKDIADSMIECIDVLIGDQVNNFVHSDLRAMTAQGAAQGGIQPFAAAMDPNDRAIMNQFSGGGGGRRSLNGSPGARPGVRGRH